MSLTLNIREDFSRNFDLSIVIPFYKKMAEFKRVFPLNHKYFERNGIEVVIVLDTPAEQAELLEFVQQYPFVNWRIVLNDKPHEWRNPAKPLNVGIRHSTKKYVMVCSPESEMVTDVIYILRKSFEDYPDYPHYAIGRVCFADEEAVTPETFNNYQFIPFGSIMFERKDAEAIHGYDETLSKWGGDDNNLRARLDMIGVNELYFNDAMMAHRDLNDEGKKRRSIPFEKRPNEALRHFFFPEKAVANDANWGRDFDKVIYDWRHNEYAESQLHTFASRRFVRFEIRQDYNSRSYPVLLLVQSFNESARIQHFLHSVSDLFDGIILLDDDSTDNTYALAQSEKIIFKGQKTRNGFNDLENRNLLLDLASFVDYELAFFLDIDETLDNRFHDIHKYVDDRSTNAYMIPYIHLWDDEKLYNTQYPSSIDGICLRYKMIRNIGHSHIVSDRGRLHFHQAPTLAKTGIATDLLIHHYGFLSKEDRKRKYDFYKKEDRENSQSSYEHFSEHAKPELGVVADISSSQLIRVAQSLKFKRV